jgi:predicted phosphodiesterase
MNTKRILIISDYHAPYQHPKALSFLKKLNKELQPTAVISIGDIGDFCGISFHEKDADLPSASEEYRLMKIEHNKLHKVFPYMEILKGNHDLRNARVGKKAGLPSFFMKDISDLIKYDGWRWHSELLIELPNGEPLYLAHDLGRNPLLSAQRLGCSVVDGHKHSMASIQYLASPLRLIFGMTVGCLVDRDSLAMAYGKAHEKKPIISVGYIEDSQPRIITMNL